MSSKQMSSEFQVDEIPEKERLTEIADTFERREFSSVEIAKIKRTVRRSPRLEESGAQTASSSGGRESRLWQL